MAQIEFLYNGTKTVIQGNYKDKFKDILQHLKTKTEINLDSVYYLYSGNTIDNLQITIDQLINNLDRANNKISILVYDIDDTNESSTLIKSKYIICPKCCENTRININNYKIKLYDCPNGHNINDLSLDDFEKSQKINISRIICEQCKDKNMSNSYNNMFYRCNECQKNLCPLCKENHDKNHNIINYNEKNYICGKHNNSYSFYCKSCKKNICFECEEEHKEHDIISFGKIISKKNDLEDKMKKFRNKINIFNNNIKEIIQNLNDLTIYVEKLYKTIDDITKNKNNKNFALIQNINDIKLTKYINDLNSIINEKNNGRKFDKIMNIIDRIKSKNNFYNIISFTDLTMNENKYNSFLKNIFSFIYEKRKLELIIYNKKVQNLLNINILNYGSYSGKYIIGERNGKGKEYNCRDKLIFEGEYLNGKRNGKGKEYNDYKDKLIFEGEYLNGKRNGKGKEYDDGELIFEGEYLNGKRNGKGKEYGYNGKLRFEGDYFNEKRNGKGKEYNYDGKLIYEGEYLNGEKNGKGKEYYCNDKLKFEGEFINGANWNGKYKEYYDKGKLKFDGEYLNGKKWNGMGYTIENKIAYEVNNGNGYIKEHDGIGNLLFEFEYKNGERNGKGKEYNENGKLIFEGEYLNGVKWNGKIYEQENNTEYILKEGKGQIKEYNENGKLIFEGEYLNGKRNGKGKEYYDYFDKLIFEGEY